MCDVKICNINIYYNETDGGEGDDCSSDAGGNGGVDGHGGDNDGAW